MRGVMYLVRLSCLLALWLNQVQSSKEGKYSRKKRNFPRFLDLQLFATAILSYRAGAETTPNFREIFCFSQNDFSAVDTQTAVLVSTAKA